MSLCSLVNRGIYGHVAEVPGGEYIHRLHTTDEYTLIFLGIEEYSGIRQRYISRLLHRLTDEYKPIFLSYTI
jgi:hypothetical protein